LVSLEWFGAILSPESDCGELISTTQKRKKKKKVYILFGDCREIESNTPRGVRARSINGKNRPEYKTCGAKRQVEQ
jgi:hypothetical protein